ncbi:M48 family metalloprotease [Paenalcaligenes sp. Me52]|uniref:M48 family metalloprotease n=1 Tax=Paenalcaligenes sp. Me52 TaxID=3392038 RepID=UPI003D27386C
MSFKRTLLSSALALSLLVQPTVMVQAQPVGIPSMGAASGAELTPGLEKLLGDAIMEQGRRDPTYIADLMVEQYLSEVGQRLAKYAPDSLQQNITIFALRDPEINAFALPGGYIGINSGLVLASKSEAELASVIGHEIAHVAQRHIARGMTQSSQSGHIMIAAMVGALLAALSGSADLAMGVATFGQAAAIDRQLGFSRQAEQEADRVGFQMLQKAGYDPTGMADMFKRLMEVSRLNEGPRNVYASTHPLSLQRLSDIESRITSLSGQNFHQDPAFWYVRAALRVIQAKSGSNLQNAMQAMRSEAESGSGVQRSAAEYGLAYAAWQRRDFATAEQHLAAARDGGRYQASALDVLAINLAQGQGEFQQAATLADQARRRWPDSQAVALVYVQSLQQQRQEQQAVDYLTTALRKWPHIPQFQKLLAEGYERLGEPIAARKAMAKYYQMIGALPTAVEQLQQARSRSKDFYEQSELDVQIRELRSRLESERLLLERFRS